MLYQINKRIKESLGFLNHIGDQIQRDAKIGDQISLTELKTEYYEQAVHHIHLAMELLNKQKELNLQYQQDEEEKEETEPSNRLSRTISEKI